MTTSIDYLEAAKIEELTSQLRDEGYRVIVHPSGEDQGYDLVAEKGNKKVAVEVTARGRLRESAETIKNLRRSALNHGYDEFRLVVVSPPREVRVSIEKLEQELFKYLKQNLPSVLAGRSVHDVTGLAVPDVNEIRPVGIGEIDIDSIDITKDGVQVVGNGVAEIEIDYWDIQEEPFWSAGFPPQDRRSLTEWKTDVPFVFDVMLNHDLKISTVQKIEVDASSFSA